MLLEHLNILLFLVKLGFRLGLTGDAPGTVHRLSSQTSGAVECRNVRIKSGSCFCFRVLVWFGCAFGALNPT